MYFSHFQACTSELFKKFNLLKVMDIIKLYTATVMYQFHKGLLPKSVNDFFTPVFNRHRYNTQFASKSSYCLPQARTSYGIFNIRFSGPKLWNSVKESIKSLSIFSFKRNINSCLSWPIDSFIFLLRFVCVCVCVWVCYLV